jgi:RTX calcium-binding nonapeptide repeat (4 copies)
VKRFRFGRFSIPTLTVLLTIVAALAIPASVAAASVSCDYTGSNHAVTVKMAGDIGTRLVRTSTGHIKVAGAWCDGIATVTNTDIIVVTGDTGNQTLNLSLANGGFKPGWTDEIGTSDEIEISVSFGGGVSDEVVVEATDAGQYFKLGRFDTSFGVFRAFNLNYRESSTVDADLFLAGVDKVGVFLEGGNDILDSTAVGASGKPFDLPLTIFGGDGNDYIVAGTANDKIYGGRGTDTVHAMSGNDLIDLQDGLAVDDGYGHDGNDACVSDPGDICNP